MDLDFFDQLLVDELEIKPADQSSQTSDYCPSCKRARQSQLEAAGSGHVLCLKHSLSREGLVAKDNFGATALHIAARRGMTQSLQCIVDVCSPVEAFRAHNKATPAHDAAGTGHLESLIFLIENTACTAHDRDRNMATPLHWAAQLGHTEVVDWLVNEAGAQPDVKNAAGLTPIHLSAAKNKLDTLKWLSNYLKNHRDDCQSYIDARALNGETPLYFSAQEGHLHVVTWLVEKMKSDIYIRANDGLAPVHAAAQEGHLECLKFLLSHMGLDILSADSATPGHYAASQGHLECLKWLLTNGVITGKEVDVYKSTLAHDAAEEGHVGVLKMIHKRGFDFSVKNEDKRTPLDIAVKNQHKECITFLRNPDSVVKKARRTDNTQESAQSVSSAVSSLPPSASEAAGETSKNVTVLEQALDAGAKVKMRKITPIPAPVGSSVDQKWVDKFRTQGQNVKQPRIEEWVNSTLDRQEKTTLLDDDSEVDLLAPVNIDAQKRLSDDVMLTSDQTKRSELQAHLQWVSQSCENNRPGESNIGKKEKERIFSEVSKSEQRQNQIASSGIGVQETEVGNQEREKEELKRKKYRELRVKEETDRMKKQQKLVAQKKEEERKFFEEQKYKYVVREPSHFGSQKLKKNRGIIGRLSNMLRKSTDQLSESRGQPDGADSETNSLEHFNKLGLLRSDSSNYDLYNLPTYQGKKKGREARKRESWIGSDTTFEDDIESDLDTELYLMKHKLFCTQYNSDNDSVVSYEDENLILISRPSEYTLTCFDAGSDDDDVIKDRDKDKTSKQRSKSAKQLDYSVLSQIDIWRDSSGSETDYESFPKLTPEELLYYEQFINTADNPNCQHPLALVYLINHFLTHPTLVGRQYYLNADEEGPEPSKILFKMLKHKIRSNPVLSLDLDDAFPSDQVTPPIAFQTSDETGRRREEANKLVDDSLNKEGELALSFI